MRKTIQIGHIWEAGVRAADAKTKEITASLDKDLRGKEDALFKEQQNNGVNLSWKVALAGAAIALVAFPFVAPAIAAIGLPSLLGLGAAVGGISGFLGGNTFGKIDKNIQESITQIKEKMNSHLESDEFAQKLYNAFESAVESQITITAKQQGINRDSLAYNFYSVQNEGLLKGYVPSKKGLISEIEGKYMVFNESTVAKMIEKANALKQKIEARGEAQENLNVMRGRVGGLAEEAIKMANEEGLTEGVKEKITALAEKLGGLGNARNARSAERGQVA